MDFEQTTSDADSLHEAIRCNDYKEVQSFLNRHNLELHRHFFNAQNESAAATALKEKRTEIYELLLEKGICLGEHEQMTNLLRNHSSGMKKKLHEIHKKHLKTSSPRHLMTLSTLSTFSYDVLESERRELLDLITKAFDDLNKLSWIEPILKVAAIIESLKIVFEFHRDSITHLDPQKDNEVLGSTYIKGGYIYIGAKGLRADKSLSSEANNARRLGVLGTLIHEISHYVINLLYDNDCKPYVESDDETFKLFSAIVNHYQSRRDSEEVISNVYKSYSSDKWEAELIVCVPQMLALYMNNEATTSRCKLENKELFDFFKTNILERDIIREPPLLEARLRVNRRNEDFSELLLKPGSFQFDSLTTEKVQILHSNCPKLSMNAIYHTLKLDSKFNSKFIFVKLQDLKDEETFNSLVKAHSLLTKPWTVIDCDEHDQKIILQYCRKLKCSDVKSKLILITNGMKKSQNYHFDVVEKSVNHFWSQLVIPIQHEFLLRKVNFQGKTVLLGNLLTDNEIENIESFPWRMLIKNQDITIGKQIAIANLEEIFIQRNFYVCDDNDRVCDVKKALNFAHDHRVVVIIDEPGMGKSIELKMMTKRLQNHFLDHWIFYMDLKEFFNVYKQVSVAFENAESIAIFFCDWILEVDGFEKDIFKIFFKSGRVIFLMDGVDEICPTYKDFILSLMSEIRLKSENQLWIATRPHLGQELKGKLNAFEIKLVPFTIANQKEFFAKFYRNKRAFVQSSEKLNEIDNFLDTLRRSSRRSGYVSNPLLLRMIAEIVEESNSFDLKNANKFTIYDEFINQLQGKCMDKGREARGSVQKQIGNSTMVKFYEKSALRTILQHDHFEKMMSQHCFSQMTTRSIDDVVRIGLMYFDGCEFQFIHRTFAEFFVAKFIQAMLFKQKFHSKEELTAVIEVLDMILSKDYEYEMIITFLEDSLETFECHRSAQKTETVQEVFKIIQSQRTREIPYWYTLVRHERINLLEQFSTYLIQDAQKFWLEKNLKSVNIFMTTASFCYLNNAEKFWKLSTKMFDHEFIQNMLLETDDNGENILFFAAGYRGAKVFEFFAHQVSETTTKDDFCQLFTSSDASGETLLHRAVNRAENFKFISEFSKSNLSHVQWKNLLKHKSQRGETLLHKICSESFFANVKLVCEILHKSLNDDLELIAFLCSPDSNGKTALMLAVQDGLIAKLEEYWEFIAENFNEESQREILLQRCHQNNYLFHYATKSNYRENFEFIANLHLELLGKDKIKEIILSSANDRNVLLYAIKPNCLDDGIIQALWQQMLDIFKHDEVSLKRFLLERIQNEKTIFEMASLFGNYKLDFLTTFVDETFTRDEKCSIGFTDK